MKKLLVVSAIAALGFSSMALANGSMPTAAPAMVDDSGVYVGINGGWAVTNWKSLGGTIASVSKDNGGVLGGVLGYDINKYFAVEAGYTYLSFFKPTINIGSDATNDFDVRNQNVVDLVGKIKAPITDDFGLFAKLGADYFWTKMNALNTSVSTYNNNTFNLVYGAGMDYSITPNVIVDAEWMRLNGNQKIDIQSSPNYFNKYKPNADLFTVGLRYKFFM